MLNAFKFKQISHLTLHNTGFGTRKIFSSEKIGEYGLKLRGRGLNLDSLDYEITMIIKQGELLITT